MTNNEEHTMTTDYETTLSNWIKHGGNRPANRPDGVPTRIDRDFHTKAEEDITQAMYEVEYMGGSQALTDAINFLQKARDRVADHVEGAI